MHTQNAMKTLKSGNTNLKNMREKWISVYQFNALGLMFLIEIRSILLKEANEIGVRP